MKKLFLFLILSCSCIHAQTVNLRVVNFYSVPTITSTAGVKFSTASEGILDVQARISQDTSSIRILPPTTPETVGTIAELVVGRTVSQVAGGNYSRFAWRAAGSGTSNVSGLVIETGGTEASSANLLYPFTFGIRVENPASTFTNYEPFRFLEGADTGNVGFGVSAAVGAQRNILQVRAPILSSAGQSDSHSFLIRGHGYDTSLHNADWAQFVDVTSNAGVSSYKIQNRIDAGSFSTFLGIADTGITILQGYGTGELQIIRAATNSEMLRLACSATDCDIISDRTGSGTYRPLIFSTNNTLRWTMPTDGGLMGPELGSDPAAPASNNGIIFFKDNGSGKTQFVVRFPTGATQVISTEP